MSDATNKSGSGSKQPPKAKKEGGFWSGLVEGFVGSLATDSAPARNPASPAARMEPVHEERRESAEEAQFRATEGTTGRPPMQRVDRQRQYVARSVESHAARANPTRIPEHAGSPLGRDVRARMEPKLGADLSGVRVHTSGDSATAAKDLGARAFTVGADVHFNAGEFAPGSKEGDKLLAHELTHVVQGQKAGVQRKAEHEDGEKKEEGGEGGAEVSDPNEPAEKEADAVSEGVADDLHGDKKEKGGKKEGKGGEGKGGEAKGGEEKAEGAGGEKPKEISRSLAPGASARVFRATKTPPPASKPATAPAAGGGPAGAAPGGAPKEEWVPIPSIHADVMVAAKADKLELQCLEGALETAISGARTGAVAKGKFPNANATLTEAERTATKAALSIASVAVKDGKIKKTDEATVKAAGPAAAPTLDCLKKFKMSQFSEVKQGGKVAEKMAVALPYGEDKKGNQKFEDELLRMVLQAESGINAQTVDEWVTNVETYRAKDADFDKMNADTKAAVCAEVSERIKTQMDRLEGYKKFGDAMTLIGNLAGAEKEYDTVSKNPKAKPDEKKAALDKVEQVRKAIFSDDYIKKNFMGRAGNQQARFADLHGPKKDPSGKEADALKAAIDSFVAAWDGIREKATESATVAHNPDGVAGSPYQFPKYQGKDHPQDLPFPGDDEETKKKWDEYVTWLKDFVSASRVNDSMGASWKKSVKSLEDTVNGQFPDKEAYPVWKMMVAISPGK